MFVYMRIILCVCAASWSICVSHQTSKISASEMWITFPTLAAFIPPKPTLMQKYTTA